MSYLWSTTNQFVLFPFPHIHKTCQSIQFQNFLCSCRKHSTRNHTLDRASLSYRNEMLTCFISFIETVTTKEFSFISLLPYRVITLQSQVKNDLGTGRQVYDGKMITTVLSLAQKRNHSKFSTQIYIKNVFVGNIGFSVKHCKALRLNFKLKVSFND